MSRNHATDSERAALARFLPRLFEAAVQAVIAPGKPALTPARPPLERNPAIVSRIFDGSR